MRPFEYRAPTSVDEALALLGDSSGRARPFAGGTDLLVQLRRNLLQLDLLVDVKRISEMNRVSLDPTEGLVVGAAVSCASLCELPDVRSAYPGLIDAASIIGGPAIRERATLGGNLCNAAPSADTIPAMIVLGATCRIASPRGIRTVAVEEFCFAPGQTVLAEDEMLVSIHFPPPKANAGAHYLRFIPRGEMDIAVTGAGAFVVLNSSRAEIVEARIALAAVAPRPLLVDSAGASLLGKAADEDAFAEAARLAQEAASPITDVRGTKAQRHHLVGVLVRRALRGAVGRAKGEAAHD